MAAVERCAQKVLFVDDEDMLVRLGGALLRALGYEPAAFSRADEALDAFRSCPDSYLAAFTDLTMPEMSGLEVARALLDRRPRLPVFIMSGHVEHGQRSAALELGVRDVLIKPLLLAQLRELLAELA